VTPVRIDTSQIPAVEVRLLCSTVLEAVMRFYEDPDNLRRFEEWRASQSVKGESQYGNHPECKHQCP